MKFAVPLRTPRTAVTACGVQSSIVESTGIAPPTVASNRIEPALGLERAEFFVALGDRPLVCQYDVAVGLERPPDVRETGFGVAECRRRCFDQHVVARVEDVLGIGGSDGFTADFVLDRGVLDGDAVRIDCGAGGVGECDDIVAVFGGEIGHGATDVTGAENREIHQASPPTRVRRRSNPCRYRSSG